MRFGAIENKILDVLGCVGVSFIAESINHIGDDELIHIERAFPKATVLPHPRTKFMEDGPPIQGRPGGGGLFNDSLLAKESNISRSRLDGFLPGTSTGPLFLFECNAACFQARNEIHS